MTGRRRSGTRLAHGAAGRRWARQLARVVAAVALALGAAPPGPVAANAPADAARSGSVYRPVTACRLADTRETAPERFDGGSFRVPVAGRCGVPAGASTVVLAVTGVGAASAGFVTVWPAGGGRPVVSSLNLDVGEIRTNTAVVALGAGAVDVHANVPMDVVIDLLGVFEAAGAAPSAGRHVAVAPTRLVDTRAGAPLPALATVTVPLPAEVPRDAVALAVTVVAVESATAGWVEVTPAGAAPSGTAILNTDRAGQTRGVGAIVPVSPAGFTVRSHAGGHVVVDLAGWFTGASAPASGEGLLVAVPPTRLVDTRGRSPIHPGGAVAVPIDALGVPVAAVLGNWTMLAPRRDGFVTGHAAGTPRPAVATVNSAHRRDTAGSFAIVRASTSGVTAWSNAGTDLVVDATAYFTGGPAAVTIAEPVVNPWTPDTERRVLAVGDSTLAGVRWYRSSQAALRGSRWLLDAESCRRLVRPSCRGREQRTPGTAEDVLRAHTGPGTVPLDVVVVMTGYNDSATTFRSDVARMVSAARAAGAQQIVWLTYRDERYAEQNAVLDELGRTRVYPDLVVADWSSSTELRHDWFTPDGIHLSLAGSYGAADYLSRLISSLHGEPCATPGGHPSTVCPHPDTVALPQDVLTSYGAPRDEIHCYLIGTSTTLQCRVDPEL